MTVIPQVREWLEKQGYSLEMRAASAFRGAGFDPVRQSSYYTDTETNKSREMDVEAISVSRIGFVDVRFFVECKSSDKPWVLLCSTDTLRNYSRLFAFCAMSKRSLDIFADQHFDNPKFGRFPWFRKDGVIGAYSFRQAFSKDVDSAYAAAMNVMKACYDHVAENKRTLKAFYFAFPVIVVDTPLIRCTLDSRGELELEEVQEGEFLFFGHEQGTCIRIVTIGHLPAFVSDAKRVADQLIEEMSDQEANLVEALKKSRPHHKFDPPE
jgi:hypothetical protein